jgi:hypothetical protein
MYRIFTTLFLTGIAFGLSSEVSAEKRERVKYCQGGRFKPCVCWQDVSKDLLYRPIYEGCGGRAAIIGRGRYLTAFSAVVRDRDNRDRWPVSGFNGCTFSVAQSEAPPARCSAFKAQQRFTEVTPEGIRQTVHCLGASGTSRLFKRVSRVTIKLSDRPNSTEDPLARMCLKSPKEPLN